MSIYLGGRRPPRLTPARPYDTLEKKIMNYRPGEIARWVIALVIPVVGGALATYGELIWGAAAVVIIIAAPPVRRYAAGVGAAFGLSVLARAGGNVAARGLVALFLGFAAIVAVAYCLSLARRKAAGASPELPWAAALTALGAVAAAAAAALFAGPPTLNLILAPLAAFAVLGILPAGERLPRAALVALAVGLALGSVKGGVGFGLVRGAEAALARGDYGAATKYARYARAAGWRARADLVRLQAAAQSGAAWPELEALYKRRPSSVSPRPFDAALALAAFARGDYEKAAMYGDLATTASPASPLADKPLSREELFRSFSAEAAGPFARGRALLWVGRYREAAEAFDAPADDEPEAALYKALALEKDGQIVAAAELYKTLWAGDRENFRAAFGLLRTADYAGLRGEIWRALGRRYGNFFVGSKLKATDGLILSKRRLSLGRLPATLTFRGSGRRPAAIIAEGYAVHGLYPIVTLTVNGRAARTFYTNVTGEDIYETTVELQNGLNEVGLIFENDYADPGGGLDRNVFVREVRIGGESHGR